MARKKLHDLPPEKATELLADWRAGLLPVKTIAVKYGVDVAELRAHAALQGWEQGDLRHAIDQEAMRAVVERAVSDDDRARFPDAPAAKLVDSAETVRRYGQIVATVNEEQRQDIARARRHAARIMTELDQLAGPEIDTVMY